MIVADTGIDYGWVMETTFVLTILIGAPIIAIASVFVSLPEWEDWLRFALGLGGAVWVVTAIAVALYARNRRD